MKQQFENMDVQTDTTTNGHVATQQIITYSPNGRGTMKISNDDSDEQEHTNSSNNRKAYGNMLLLRPSTPHLSLGPDYWCFIPAFIAFSVCSYFVIKLVLSTTESKLFQILTLIICIGQPLSYLLVALSNPGVVTEPAREGPESKDCGKCRLVVPRLARHCKDCNVCIVDYDHHCPWTSKCIGGGNLVRFYVFLGWTPIYLIYITVAFVVCMSSNLLKVQQLRNGP